jgi:hypothetical protein
VGTEKTYTPEEVTAIVSSALRRHRDTGSVSYDELKEIGAELGIPPQDLAEAASHLATERDMEQARQKWLARQRLDLRHHVTSYVIVNSFLFMTNAITSPHHWWFYWPLLGWGIGLAFQVRSALFPHPLEVDKGARKILAKERVMSRLYSFLQ